MTDRTRWTIVIVISVVIGLIAFCCLINLFGTNWALGMLPAGREPLQWRSGTDDRADMGAAIYLTGIGEDGRVVPFRGGVAGLGLYGMGCAVCHGPDGRGGARMSVLDTVPPDIRYATLTQAATREGARRSRYTDETIRRAIVQGVDSDGRRLSNGMPRYTLRETELDALLGRMKDEG